MVRSGFGFEILSSKVEYKNPYFKVVNYRVKRPSGIIKPFWTVSKYGDFSIIIPIFPNNETVLVGQYRLAVGHYSWEFPMGQVRGRAPLGTAKQELIEETGIRARDWKKISSYDLANGHHEQKVHVFVASNLTQGESQPEEGEILKTKKLKITEVGNMIKTSKIKDGPTIVAYHYLEEYLNMI